MIEQLVQFLTGLVTLLIQTTSYLGIALLMALESANLPIPSEVVLPFSGFLVTKGVLNFYAVIIFAVVGQLIGGIISYAIGRWLYPWFELFAGGWGKLVVTLEEIHLARRWFEQWGNWVVLVGRMLPIVRTYISLAAGAAAVPFKQFVIYSLIGTTLWSVLLTYAGYQLGNHWDQLGPTFRQFDYLIIGLVIILLAWLVVRHLRRLRG